MSLSDLKFMGWSLVLLWLVSWLPVYRPASQAQTGESIQVVEGQLLNDLTTDTDRDGIFDEQERALGTNPQSADSDGDGFDDLFEINYREFGFNPLVPTSDRDKDGLSDAFELASGTSPDNVDSDRDGYSDFDEVLNAFFGYDPRVPTQDTDFDGLADSLELRLGTSPGNPDSDSDGASDFQEYKAGLDPTIRDPSDSFGELAGTTYSQAMRQALLSIRNGGTFPTPLADELPYPEVTVTPIIEGVVRPSAALVQLSVFNPTNSPGLYDSYDEIVKKLQNIAQQFDGTPNARIVRLFRWSQPTGEKRYIYALKISDKPQNNEAEPEILFMGMHHARELITTSIPMGLIKKLTDGYAAGDPEIKSIVNYTEIWVIPVVNPDGYTKALGEFDDVLKKKKGARVDWRKNTRKVAELTPEGKMQMMLGVDPNRNYGFEHIRTLGAAQLAALTPRGKDANGLRAGGVNNCKPDPDYETYAADISFSEVETRAVKGLANSIFSSGNEVSGLKCSLSWHSFGGEVAHPLGHNTSAGLTVADKKHFNELAEAVAKATGYKNLKDTYKDTHYPTYGDSDDWLYKEKNIFALTVEAFSDTERAVEDPDFFPIKEARRDAVVENNLKGALALIKACSPSDLGDAPDNNIPQDYPTRRDNNGALHLDYRMEWLGSSRDPDPSVSRELDAIDPFDEDGVNNLVDGDKFDDGVTLPNVILPGQQFRVVVRVNTTIADTGFGPLGRYAKANSLKRIYLNAWADWQNDNSWKQSGDKIIGTGSPTGTMAIDPETFGPNGEYTLGEAFQDVGADGVPGTNDAGEGNGVYDKGEPFTDTAGQNFRDFVFLLTPPSSLPEPGVRTIWFRFRLDYGEDVGGALNPISDPNLKEEEGPAQFGEVEDYKREAIEMDFFPNSLATVNIQTPLGSDTVQLSGPTKVNVFLSRLADTDGDGLEQVPTEMVQLELTGTSRLAGPVKVRLRSPTKHPFRQTSGEIEENANTQSGRLDLPPFATSGTAHSFFAVFFEVEIPSLQVVLHNHAAKLLQTEITNKPPGRGESYGNTDVIPLFDEQENMSGVSVADAHHTPNPAPHQMPRLIHLIPNSAIAGSGAFMLTANGMNFVNGHSTVRWNGADRATTFVSDTQLRAAITALDVAAAGTASVTVFTNAPGGGLSNALPFTIVDNRIVRVVPQSIVLTNTVSVPIELIARGDENALGFSLTFAPTILRNPLVSLGSDATGATLNADTSQAAQGRLGLRVALPAGRTFAAGTRQIVSVAFSVLAIPVSTTTTIGFEDQPLRREVTGVMGTVLPATYVRDTVTITRPATTVSAASFAGAELASEAIVAAFGTELATTTQLATTLPLPTTLAGTTVKVRDIDGRERLAPLFFVSPTQINYQLPPGTTTGVATVTITSGEGAVSTGNVNIAAVAPGLFTANANGQGVPAGYVLRFRNGVQLPREDIARFDPAQNRFVSVPIDLGPATDQSFLILFGTGIRFRSALSVVTLKLGGEVAQTPYAGSQNQLVGLDQVNALLPRSLIGRGEVELLLTVDGKVANAGKRITINIR